MLSLARALFGDFDIDDIMNNSRLVLTLTLTLTLTRTRARTLTLTLTLTLTSGYLNAVLFLIYLFVAVFILLSMFLAILGESQAAVALT